MANFFKKLVKKGGALVSTGATFGAANTEGSGYAQKIAAGKDVGLTDFVSQVKQGQDLQGIAMAQPDLPVAEDPADQLARAQAESDAKLAGDVAKRANMGGTLLGGSILEEPSVLKKKKLLGA